MLHVFTCSRMPMDVRWGHSLLLGGYSMLLSLPDGPVPAGRPHRTVDGRPDLHKRKVLLTIAKYLPHSTCHVLVPAFPHERITADTSIVLRFPRPSRPPCLTQSCSTRNTGVMSGACRLGQPHACVPMHGPANALPDLGLMAPMCDCDPCATSRETGTEYQLPCPGLPV